VHATDQLSVRVKDLGLIARVMARFRATPPSGLGCAGVVSVEDLLDPATGLPPTDGLRLRTGLGVRVIVRPSGTEPKLKCYLEAIVPVGDRAQLPAARARAAERLDAVRADLETFIDAS
jgi:phosphomannomutase